MDRRQFLKYTSSSLAYAALPFGKAVSAGGNSFQQIKISDTDSNFKREPLIQPFGIKGGYLTELWQTVSRIESEAGNSGFGIATQSVLYGDDDLFGSFSEAGGNALMYGLTESALQQIKRTSFSTPVELMEDLVPEMQAEGKRITGKQDLGSAFVLNSLVSVDHALWLLYAAENHLTSFESMVPDPYREAFSHRNRKVAVMVPVTYGMSMEDLRHSIAQGFFIIQIKTGHPGTQEEMLEADKARLTQVHQTLGDLRTDQTEDGRIVYVVDPNSRYEKKETLQRFLDHARNIGAFDQIFLIEDPLDEQNREDVSDLGVRIAADDNLNNAEDAFGYIDRGYDAFILKGIAKTLSLTLKVAKIAHDRGIPCICGDLTVNPVLIDWNKNLAARLAPFPQLGMGILATNGHMNYRNWDKMVGGHPFPDASWTQIQNGVFKLNNEFYDSSGGILTCSPYVQDIIPDYND